MKRILLKNKGITFVLMGVALACVLLPGLEVASSPPILPDKTSTAPAPTDIPAELTPTPIPDPVRFAVIGDYGDGGSGEKEVAELIKDWKPDLILTVGDNNYPAGDSRTIDDNIGQFFADYIFPYQGNYSSDAERNLFFPTLGNHDIWANDGQPYLDYFTLPGNERYYTFNWDQAQFFALNSNDMEPDGFRAESAQAQWLQNELAASNADWKVVYFHHPPYSSGDHGPSEYMRWPFADWGADVVISGHDHTYERLEVDGLTYIVNGLGGHHIYNFTNLQDASQVRYNGDYGALFVEAFADRMHFEFVNHSGDVVDEFEIKR